MIKIVDGDILQATEDIWCHQTNAKGVMGGGIAKQTKEKYPEVYKAYKELCEKHNSKDLLGAVQYVECHDGYIIANLFGQEGFGRNKQYTDYNALRNALNIVYKRVKRYHESVAIPFNIGCGLAGGSWPFVYSMIEEVFHDYDVTLYRWEVK